MKVKEIYNFTQDDLTTEDVLVLNCHNEIYVWLGCHANVGGKEQALDLAHKFLEKDVLDEGISLDTPIYVVTEGQEPPLFTQFFQWDFAKANMHGNSFERKLAVLKGKLHNLDSPVRKSWKALSRETTPDGSSRTSVSPYQPERSLSPAFRGLGPHLKSPNRDLFSSPTQAVRKLDLTSSLSLSAGSPTATSLSHSPVSSKSSEFLQNNGDVAAENLSIYPYERLTVVSKDPIGSIDVTKREAYLSKEEFEEKFGMEKTAFYKLPKWKQNKLKMTLHLF